MCSEGSVRRDGDQLRVTAQLIDAQSGYNVWSQTDDRTWRDLLVIQDDLAHSIVDALQLVLSTDVKAHLGQQLHAQPRRIRSLPRGARAFAAQQGNRRGGAIVSRGSRARSAICTGLCWTLRDLCDRLREYSRYLDRGQSGGGVQQGPVIGFIPTGGRDGTRPSLRDSGRSARAVEYYRKAVATNPRNAEALTSVSLGRMRNRSAPARQKPLMSAPSKPSQITGAPSTHSAAF